MNLWPHQIKADQMMRQAWREGHRAIILNMPTGAGKTNTTAHFISGAALKGRKVIAIAHRHELILQMSGKLKDYGLDHGIIAAGEYMNCKPVQVASIQTLVRRLNKLPWKPDILALDECHLSASASYRKVISAFPEAFLIGMTATPWRLDGQGLGKEHGGHFDAIVSPTTPAELVANGYLVPPRVYAPITPNLDGVKQSMGDFDQRELAEAMDKPSITGDTVSHWLKLAKGRPTIAFCVSIEHANHVAEQFRAAGIPARAISSQTDMHSRLRAVSDLGNGSLDVLCNCGLFIEGLDQPAVSCIILLAPTKSLTRYLQSVGRGLRIYPGKSDCIILDHASNALTHGLPSEPRDWSLAGREKRARSSDTADRLRVCKQCYAANPIGAVACRECGAVFEVKPRVLQQREGELIEIKTLERKQARREEGQARTLEDWQRIARARNYSPQWARIRHQLRNKRA